MNGAQVTSLQGILLAVSEGKLPKEAAKAAIGAAFPLLEPAEINGMVDPIEVKPPVLPPPSPAPPPGAAVSEEEEMPETEAMELIDAFTKQLTATA